MFKFRKEEKAISPGEIPKHIGVIMDRNGRWARKRMQPRVMGHKAGIGALQDVTIAASEPGIKVLTVYAFSTENWSRPKDKVRFIMNLSVEFFDKYVPELDTNSVKAQVISETDRLSKDTFDAIKHACEKTKRNFGSILNFALNYDGRSGITEVVKNIAQKVLEAKVNLDDITEDVISNHLMTNHLLYLYHDPDLVIRTGNELRLSNFLPWQSAYSEFYFTPVLWPDFKKDELIKVIAEYNRRHRCFGGIQRGSVMKQRMVQGAIILLILLPFLLLGDLSFQVSAGLLAMIGVAEVLRMKRLEFFSTEGALAVLRIFVLTVPLDNYFTSLPLDSGFSVYGLLVFLLLAGTVSNNDDYPSDGISYPIAADLYVGIGFQNLVNAHVSSLDKILFVLLIAWATDIGVYMIGRRFRRRKLLPRVPPNKTVEGSLGGIVCAIIVALIFTLVDKAVYTPHSPSAMLIYVVLFSVFGQFSDLVKSTIKRHFGVKDSDELIPSHGGTLDRFNSMIFAFPVMHLFGLF